MANNSDLNSTQNVSNTASPQSTDTSIGASDSNQFQKSADASALNQNKTVTVAPNGQPLSSAKSTGSTAASILFVVVASLALLLLASSVFRFVMKRPDPVPKAPARPKEEKKPAVATTKKKGKSKKSRSARHK